MSNVKTQEHIGGLAFTDIFDFHLRQSGHYCSGDMKISYFILKIQGQRHG